MGKPELIFLGLLIKSQLNYQKKTVMNDDTGWPKVLPFLDTYSNFPTEDTTSNTYFSRYLLFAIYEIVDGNALNYVKKVGVSPLPLQIS